MAGLGVQREISVSSLVKRIEALEERVRAQDREIQGLHEADSALAKGTLGIAERMSLWQLIFSRKAGF